MQKLKSRLFGDDSPRWPQSRPSCQGSSKYQSTGYSNPPKFQSKYHMPRSKNWDFVPHSKRDVSQTLRVHSVLENLNIGPTSQQLVPLHKTYESSWNRWCRWCSGRQIDLLSSSINDIIFLTVFNGGLEHHILNVFCSAISSTHSKIDGFSVGQHPYQHTWNVDVKYIISLEKTALCHLKYLKKLAMQINRHEHFFTVLTKIKNSVPWDVIDNI